MNYISSAATDIGLVKEINQDSFSVKYLDTRLGKIIIAVMCDGMGGLDSGEIASASVVHAFNLWILNRLPELCFSGISEEVITKEWTGLVEECNSKLIEYGSRTQKRVGTTVTAIMLTETKYFVINIGDSRAYELYEKSKVLTKDHSLVAKEIELGRLTVEEAKNDSRRSMLLQCVGAEGVVDPDFFFGETKKNAVYMLCSDGFIHEITEEELYEHLMPIRMSSVDVIRSELGVLIELNKERQETDNISVIAIRTY